MGEEHISTITDYGVEIVSALTSCNPRQTSWTGAALIVLVGLLNFHVPHFLLESRDLNTTESRLIPAPKRLESIVGVCFGGETVVHTALRM